MFWVYLYINLNICSGKSYEKNPRKHFIDDNDIKAVVDVLQNHPLKEAARRFFRKSCS